MYSPSLFFALWIPGVSKKTICPFSPVYTVCILFLVVCGFLEVMAIFCPIKWFIKVDFPTFGLPIIATNPDLKSALIRSCSIFSSLPTTQMRFCSIMASTIPASFRISSGCASKISWRSLCISSSVTLENQAFKDMFPFVDGVIGTSSSLMVPMMYFVISLSSASKERIKSPVFLNTSSVFSKFGSR